MRLEGGSQEMSNAKTKQKTDQKRVRPAWLEEPPPSEIRYLDQAVEAYRTHLVTSKAPSLRSYEAGLRRTSDDLGSLRLDEIRPTHVAMWIRRLRAEEVDGKPRYAGNTVRKFRGLLSAVLSHAMREGAIDRNVARGLPKGIMPAAKPRDTFCPEAMVLTPFEISRIASTQQIPLHLRTMYTMFGLTGARELEGLGMQWRDIRPTDDLDRLTIARQWDPERRIFRETKTKKTKRVPVHPVLREMLHELAAQWPARFGRLPQPQDVLFSAEPTKRKPNPRPLCRSNLLPHWHRDLAALGLAPRTLHSLRHSFLTNLSQLGVHSDVAFAMTHASEPDDDIRGVYRHWQWSTLCEAVRRLPVVRTRDMEQIDLFGEE